MTEPNGTDERQTVPAVRPESADDPARTRAHHEQPGTDTVTGSRPARGPGRTLPEPPPGYELLAELGRGGMGVVYRARQIALNREVALKTVLNAAAADRVSIARFWAEAEVMAAVRHPNVAQVYELGEHAGAPFIAMEYLPGGSLADLLTRGSVEPRAGAALVSQIARGVAAAHELGIVHRDLKPANVLLANGRCESAGEGTHEEPAGSRRPFALTPKVTDFGLAKRGASDLTHTNAVMGTPAYMAPEQAKGEAKFVGPAADVWALGVILYECLAGERPFVGTTAQVLGRVTSEEPPALRARVAGLPRALDTIVAKCLEKEPLRRYPNAAALADDLDRYARGEPILARPAGRAERAVMWARRNPTRAGLYAALVAATFLLLVGGALAKLWLDAKGARDTAEGAKTTAEGAREEAVQARLKAEAGEQREAALRAVLARTEYARAVDLAHREYHANNVGRALALLDSCPVERRGWEWHHVHRLCNGHVHTLAGHTGRVTAARYRPDGAHILTASADGTAKVWDATTGAELLTLKGHTAPVWFAEYNAAGTRILTAGDDHTPVVWDAITGAKLFALVGHAGAITSARFDFFTLFTSSADGTVRTWNPTTGEQITAVKTPGFGTRRELRARVDSPKRDRMVQLMLLREDALPLPIEELRDPETQKPMLKLEVPVSGESAAFSADGGKVLIGTHDREAVLFDARTGKVLARTRGHTGPVTAVGLNPDATRFVTGSLDSTARVWLARPADPLWAGPGGIQGHVGAITFNPEGTKFALTDLKNRPSVRDMATGAIQVLAPAPGHVLSTAWGPAGLRLAVGVSPGGKGTHPAPRLVFWDPVAGKEVGAGGVTPLAASANRTGTRFVTAHRDKKLRVWDAGTGAELADLPILGANGVRVAIDDAGTRVAVAEARGVEVWDVRERKLLRRIEGRTDIELTLDAFTVDGRLLLRYRNERSVVLYNIETGAPEATVRSQGGYLTAVALSPDGARLVTADDDEAVRVWDRHTGQELLTFRLPHPVAAHLHFTPDGLALVAVRGTPDRPFFVWDATPVNRAIPKPQFGPRGP